MFSIELGHRPLYTAIRTVWKGMKKDDLFRIKLSLPLSSIPEILTHLSTVVPNPIASPLTYHLSLLQFQQHDYTHKIWNLNHWKLSRVCNVCTTWYTRGTLGTKNTASIFLFSFIILSHILLMSSTAMRVFPAPVSRKAIVFLLFACSSTSNW